MNRIWIIPVNDGEAVEARDLLREAGETVLESGQPWGASWARIEPGIVDRIRQFQADHPDGTVYGFELAGDNQFGGLNVDHHRYAGDDRSHPLSSLEQVTRIIGVELNRYQRFVAANDVGYIPAMERLAAEFGIDETEIGNMITIVRAADRCAQGITPEDEALAIGDVANAIFSQGGPLGPRVELEYSTPSTTAQADLLYGKAVELLFKGPKWIYFGPRAKSFVALELPEHNWSGGSEDRGYFGVISPGPKSQQRILNIFRN